MPTTRKIDYIKKMKEGLQMLGAIEAGGTKFVCAIATEDGTIIEKVQIPTEIPDTTIPKVLEFFQDQRISALGIGSFGPLDVHPDSETYGFITSTPKPGWINFPFVKTMKEKLQVPVAFDTDVNAAVWGEFHAGAGKNLNSCLYITVGTGIGAGAVAERKLIHGWSHPEMGHISLRRHSDDHFPGVCPYHRDCLEGLAAGPAIEKRWGQKGDALPVDHPAWEMEAHYLAQALMQYVLILSPEKIIMGGGVMKQRHLFPLIRSKVEQLAGNFLTLPAMDTFIVPPALKDDSGAMGAILMAQQINSGN
ncbi:ROK family protein [Siminovitchia sediminis]|uniref:fructokinase n=1 Tax=Siminovitchia sediminis TaxID=1274353 RepID=A0ABW4KHN8_9BACI